MALLNDLGFHTPKYSYVTYFLLLKRHLVSIRITIQIKATEETRYSMDCVALLQFGHSSPMSMGQHQHPMNSMHPNSNNKMSGFPPSNTSPSAAPNSQQQPSFTQQSGGMPPHSTGGMGGPNSFGNQNSFGGMPPGGYGGYGGMADMYPNNAGMNVCTLHINKLMSCKAMLSNGHIFILTVNPNQQVPMQSGQGGQSSSKSDFGLEDLNFDPDTLIGADGTGEQTDFGNVSFILNTAYDCYSGDHYSGNDHYRQRRL